MLAPFMCSRGPPLQQQLLTVTDKYCHLSDKPHSDPGISHERECSLASLSSPSEQWHCSLAASSSLPSILSSLIAPHDLMLLWSARTSLSGYSSWEEKVFLKWYLPHGISMPSKPVPHHIPCSVSLKEIISSRLKAV